MRVGGSFRRAFLGMESATKYAADMDRAENWVHEVVPLYADPPQERVVRLPAYNRHEPAPYEGGWNLAMSAV